ncbi:carboxyl-terminal protease [Paenibacillus mucilaginosus 3016]|uniref:Carboxyl-terminal protease n=2 Tax=Paenibacillus mucilaginosus TaxID=61624 RepID=H6ND30_9BACL|nr:S41 family peptidase [Paenibacillus mucilaginosus]AFC29991.1 carboxyl-terminal protease [Paenibacillus mucilaginosus 3016]AFH62178.1 carboxyl-terminal protease [Paenibacillus mucilaginosus K02]AFK65403.1 carboxyl-terminal protease [Paenibacillus mucilaginosus K02]WFA18650.1 PDZ domain-containing protein [Paenibacillus mucilaginosus]
MKRKKSMNMWRRSAAAVLSMTLLLPAAQPLQAAGTESSGASRVQEVMELLQKKHVSAPSADALSDAAVKAMVESLEDPYTQYFTPEELQQFEDAVENQYVGIGVRIGLEPEGVYIADVFEGSPAKEAGLAPGDLIVTVGGTSVAGKKTGEVAELIAGEPGTTVVVGVVRGSETKEFTVSRKKVQIPTVVSRVFPSKVGYLEIASFSSDADELLEKELAELKSQGIRSLILDLRDNPGGLLESAKGMIRQFVKEGTLIHTLDSSRVDKPVEFSGGTTQPFPLYVLVNENSASASEVLTGALQDYGAAKVIGAHTYGKGSVQSVYELEGGGALKVTIEEYLTPKNRKVNHVGLDPDVAVEGYLAQLLTALRLAGEKEPVLTADPRITTVGGVMVQDTLDVVREGGQTYVPARALAAYLGGTVQWNEASRSVVLVSADGTTMYTPGEGGFLLKEGTGFVSLNGVSKDAFGSSLQWIDDGRKLTIRTGASK